MRAERLLEATAVGLTAAYGALQWLGRTYGATERERHRAFPGDGLVAHPHVTTTHATTIDATPDAVWPWLVQMGWGRAQWYTARWVDEMFFPRNGPSADRLVRDWQHLEVGDRILDGPPEAHCAFVVEDLEPCGHLVLRSTQHVLPGLSALGASVAFTWTFVLEPVGTDRTRFLFRSRATATPWWVEAIYVGLLVPADFVMARQMLHGVRERAERTTPEELRAIA